MRLTYTYTLSAFTGWPVNTGSVYRALDGGRTNYLADVKWLTAVVQCPVSCLPFGALTLLVGRQEDRTAVGTEFLSPYPPHTHTHVTPAGRASGL